jgi:Flp pilus assembly protein TadD
VTALARRLAGLFSATACCVLAACANFEQDGSLTPDSRLQVAEAAEASGDHQLALSMYMTAAESAPGNITVQLRAADALARGGKVQQAKDLLKQRLKDRPDQPDLTRALGLIELMSGHPAEGLALLDKALALGPGDDRTLLDKAVALDLLGRHAEAQAIYQQELAKTPNDPTVRNDYALSLMLQGRISEARAQLASLKDLEGSPERLRNNLGIIYAASGEREKSRELLGDRIPESVVATLTRAITSPSSVRTVDLPASIGPHAMPVLTPDTTRHATHHRTEPTRAGSSQHSERSADDLARAPQ